MLHETTIDTAQLRTIRPTTNLYALNAPTLNFVTPSNATLTKIPQKSPNSPSVNPFNATLTKSPRPNPFIRNTYQKQGEGALSARSQSERYACDTLARTYPKERVNPVLASELSSEYFSIKEPANAERVA